LLISQSKKFIFLHIPKTAGSSLRNALAEHTDLDTYRLESYPTVLGGQGHMQQSYLLKSGLWSDFQGYYEFTVVREPLSRLLGIYNYNFNRRNTWSTITPSKHGSFARFAQHVKMTYQHRPYDNLFYHSQLEWLEQPLTDRVHVYKFEDLIKDITPLSQSLGLDINLPHDNINENKLVTMSDLSSQEIKYCLDFLSEEYDRLDYVKP
jgi:hypothetical protein